jgi:hypothetical protein
MLQLQACVSHFSVNDLLMPLDVCICVHTYMEYGTSCHARRRSWVRFPEAKSDIQTLPMRSQCSAINPVAARNTHQSIHAIHREPHDIQETAVSIRLAALASISLTMASLPTAGPSRQASGNRRQQELPKVKRYEHHDQDTTSRCFMLMSL